MKTITFDLFGASLTLLVLFLCGCGSAQNATPVVPQAQQHDDHSGHGDQINQDEQKANLAKLSDDDRLLAEAQGYCAVMAEPLGSMGPPFKLIVNEQPVFVCCKGCEKKAKSDPDKTLARVAELKAKVQAEK